MAGRAAVRAARPAKGGPGFGQTAAADLPGLTVELPFGGGGVEEHQLRCHVPIMKRGCDKNVGTPARVGPTTPQLP